LVYLVILMLTAPARGRIGFEEEGLEQVDRRGPDPIKQIQETWQQWHRVLIWGAACLLLVAAVWIIKPFRFLDAASDRML